MVKVDNLSKVDVIVVEADGKVSQNWGYGYLIVKDYMNSILVQK